MITSFFKKMFSPAFKSESNNKICLHLNLESPNELLDLFQLEQCYQVTNENVPKERCAFTVNQRQVVFYRTPFASLNYQFTNEETSLETYKFLDYLFSMLPAEKQAYFKEHYYDPTFHNVDLGDRFNSRISYKSFKTMSDVIERYLDFRSIRLISQDPDFLIFLSDSSCFKNLEITIFRTGGLIAYSSEMLSHLPFETALSKKMEECAQIDFPDINFDQFVNFSSEKFNWIFAMNLVHQYIDSREYQVKSKFNPEVRIDEKFLRNLKNSRHMLTVAP